MTSLVFTLASGAHLRIGQEVFRLNRAYNVRIPPSHEVWCRSEVHTVEHQLTFLRWLGIEVPDTARGTLYVNSQARERIHSDLAAKGIELSKYLIVHPTATLFTKQWPEKNFAQLGDLLVEKYGLPVIFTAGPHEAQTLDNVGRKAQKKHFYFSALPLEELIALIDGCRLFVGNDSGPTHAAAALGRPVVVVWGSSDRIAWRPWQTKYELIRSDLPCMPCPGYTCAAFGQPKCILDISVDRVFEACTRIIAQT
jgi:ADP-heptose:LPS heptosyltransferase